MTDATAKLSKLLSAARGRRTLDDAMGFLRREPSTKRLLSTTNARSYLSANSFLKTPDGASSASDPGSPDLAASMRLVRSYAALVKQMPPSPETAAFSNFPTLQAPQGDSFIDRGRVESFRDRFLAPQDRGCAFRCAFRKERLRRRQSLSSPPPPVSLERSPEPFPEPCRSILRVKYFSLERTPSGNNVLFKAGSALAETRLITQDGPLARTRSDEIRPSPRLASPPLRRGSFGFPSSPPAPSSSKRFHKQANSPHASWGIIGLDLDLDQQSKMKASGNET
ncbi:hypothetical protein T484DRAFT_1906720 [Baffinella frigidus]|nr:hypothetical protein T484DRAFT_1906720 [Cryptophyta sp. CCMP2293]